MPILKTARRSLACALTLCCSLALIGGIPRISAADEGTLPSTPLPIGDPDLPETRESRTLAPGVTLTSITRGDVPADEDDILTTQRGPWGVQVLTIDPRRADGHLAATFGPDLGQTETTTDLADHSGALAAMNASFFTFTSSPDYPGDPVGTGIFAGQLLSEPLAGDDREHAFLIDATTQQARIAKLGWSETLTNKSTRHSVAVEYLNHPPVVPEDCADLTDQSTCAVDGDIVRFTPEFGSSTPAGHGVEIVLDADLCVASVKESRGVALAPGQTSVQATGRDVAALTLAAGSGCLKTGTALTDEQHKKVRMINSTFGVTGRYRLITDGTVVAPPVTDDFTNRNPRSAIGTTSDGKIIMFTVDGRQTTSVGTTLTETALVAEALGLEQALNLDGGGSTTMVAEGEVVNAVSGSTQRKVGDALIYVDKPYRSGR